MPGHPQSPTPYVPPYMLPSAGQASPVGDSRLLADVARLARVEYLERSVWSQVWTRHPPVQLVVPAFAPGTPIPTAEVFYNNTGKNALLAVTGFYSDEVAVPAASQVPDSSDNFFLLLRREPPAVLTNFLFQQIADGVPYKTMVTHIMLVPPNERVSVIPLNKGAILGAASGNTLVFNAAHITLED